MGYRDTVEIYQGVFTFYLCNGRVGHPEQILLSYSVVSKSCELASNNECAQARGLLLTWLQGMFSA
jgi:hypothetical protein